MARCEDCKLHEKCDKLGKRNLIYGRGVSKAKYMVILDYPTKQDWKWDVSPTGDVELKLKYFLEKAGIPYNEVYVTNAIKCPLEKDQAGKVKKEYINACAQYLLSEIEKYQPEVIIPAGKLAFQMLSGQSSVDEFVGHSYNFKYKVNEGSEQYPKIVERKYKCFPTYSINGSLFMWKWNNRILMSLKKAKQYVKDGTVDRTEKPKVKIVLSLEDLEEFRKEMLSLKFSATDNETSGLWFFKHKIICSGYSVSPTKAWVVFHNTYKKKHTKKWTQSDIILAKKINKFVSENRERIIEVLKEVHGSNIKWFLHNAKFDQKFNIRAGIPLKRIFADTMIGDSLIDENEGHSLNEVYVRNGINYGPYDTRLWKYVGKKSQKTYFLIPPLTLAEYLGFDVCGVHILGPKQMQELKEIELYDHFMNIKMPTINEVLIPTEYKGVKYDKEMLLESSEAIKNRILKTLVKLQHVTERPDFNPNSTDHINEYLNKNKFPFHKYDIKETQKGHSTGKDAIEKITSHPKFNKFGILLGNYKKLVKIKGTYIDGKDGDRGMLQYFDENDFLHANYNCWSPVTSRYSCNKPSLQTFPRPIEGIVNTRQFIMKSEEDLVLFEADYSAIEQYIVAIESKDDVLIEKIKDGTDIHAFNATTLGKALGWIADDITYEMFLKNCGKDPRFPNFKKDDPKTYKIFDALRTKAKTVGFGLNYGKGAESFAKEFGIPVEEVNIMIDAYFDLYKKMYAWRVKITERAVERGILKLPSGRMRRFTMATDWIHSKYGKKSWSARIIKEGIERQAMNFPIQGGAHEAFEAGCLNLVRKFKSAGLSNRTRIILSNHDGILGECLPSEMAIIKKIIPEAMIKTYNAGTKWELTTKIEVGFYKERWYGEEIS